MSFYQGRLPYRSSLTAAAIAMLSGFVLPPNPTRAAENAAVIEEVIVTARKRDESLQEVPISITAFDEEMLENIGATELVDILQRTPNFYQPYLGEAKGQPPSIRGVVSGSSRAGADPAVGFYLDEVYLGNTAASSFDLFDIENFEVLRGPQGTLFGRNTIGGAINIRTKKPTDEFEGAVSLSYGNYDAKRIRTTISGPLVEDKLYGKISAVSNDRDGFIKNRNPGHGDLRSEENWFVRSQLRFIVSEASEVMATFDYRDLDQLGGGYEADGQNVFFSGAIPNLTFIYDSPLNHSVNWNEAGVETMEAWGASLDVTHQFESFELRSITAYREHDYFSEFDTDLSPNRWVNDGSPEDQEQFSQEIRLTSTEGERLSWIAGIYYFSQETLNQDFITFQQDILPLLGAPPGTPDLKAQANGFQETESQAVFVHIDYALTDQLDVALGLRFTHDSKDLDYTQNDETGGFFGGSFAVKDSNSWTELTGDFTLSYKWTSGLMTYFSYAHGYKAGGFNDNIGVSDNPPFDPEFVDSYEIGFKSSWYDNRLTFNTSVFYLDWEDIQTSGFVIEGVDFRNITGNFGSAESKGIEMELVVLPIEGLELTASYGRQDGESEANALHGITATSSLTGPDYSFAASILYKHELPAINGRLSWYADVQVQGPNELVKNFDNRGFDLVGANVDSYSLVNARLAYESASGKWSFSLWGKNITDKSYVSQYFDGGGNPLIVPGAIVLGEPATYGAEYRLNF